MEAGSTWYMNGADSLGLTYEQEVKASGLVEHKQCLGEALVRAPPGRSHITCLVKLQTI
jgi:hypothetical protein